MGPVTGSGAALALRITRICTTSARHVGLYYATEKKKRRLIHRVCVTHRDLVPNMHRSSAVRPRTLHPFNNGRALRVVRLDDSNDDLSSFGIINEERMMVWCGLQHRCTDIPMLSELATARCLKFLNNTAHGKLSIGGSVTPAAVWVSCASEHYGCIVVFATHALTEDAVATAPRQCEDPITLGTPNTMTHMVTSRKLSCILPRI